MGRGKQCLGKYLLPRIGGDCWEGMVFDHGGVYNRYLEVWGSIRSICSSTRAQDMRDASVEIDDLKPSV